MRMPPALAWTGPLVLMMLLLVCGGPAMAQRFPAKPVNLVVPYPPGGAGDVAARKLADAMSRRIGQAVVILNQPGRDGIIGTAAVTRAQGDGYTLLAGDPSPVTLSAMLRTDLPFDPVKDLTPIAEYLYVPLILVAQTTAPFKTVKEFVEHAKAHPGKLRIGTGSTLLQIGSELLRQKAGLEVLSVPYKGGAASVQDLLGGHIDAVVTSTGPVSGLIASGKLKVLAVFGHARAAALPDVPTMAESGYPDIVVGAWFGIFGPKGMPADVVATLSQHVAEAAKSDEMRALAQQFGGEISIHTREGFARRIAAERDAQAPIVKAAGMAASD